MFNLSIDLYFSIFKYLNFEDICHLFRTCKFFNMLKSKEQIVEYLFQYDYPHNLFNNNITMYQNYMYHIIIGKIIKDNYYYICIYYNKLCLQGTKRKDRHSMTIPILLPNLHSLAISESTKYALKRFDLYNNIYGT